MSDAAPIEPPILPCQTIIVGDGDNARTIAVQYLAGQNPGLVWLGGYRSDMAGTKALALEKWCAERGLCCCRHDYSGHGQSGGAFLDGTISRWLEESITVFEHFTTGPQVLVGSSMGAWVALRMVAELKARGDGDRLHGLLLIAPAPDFTEELMWPNLSKAQKRMIAENGFLEEPSQYSNQPNIFTEALFADGRNNLVMTGTIITNCPVHIIQGMKDRDVPHNHAARLAAMMPADQVTMTYVKDGDHRLSRDADIALVLRAAERLIGDH